MRNLAFVIIFTGMAIILEIANISAASTSIMFLKIMTSIDLIIAIFFAFQIKGE